MQIGRIGAEGNTHTVYTRKSKGVPNPLTAQCGMRGQGVCVCVCVCTCMSVCASSQYITQLATQLVHTSVITRSHSAVLVANLSHGSHMGSCLWNNGTCKDSQAWDTQWSLLVQQTLTRVHRSHLNTRTHTLTHACTRVRAHTHTHTHTHIHTHTHKKQSMQLVHVSLSSCHSAVLGTQLGKVCYYSITHSSAPPSHGSHVSPAFEQLPALPQQVSLTGLDKDGPPTPSSLS